MSGDEPNEEAPFKEERHGGRYLLGGMAAAAVILLSLIGSQTVRGSEVSGRLEAGWWAEPGLSPAVFLVITVITSAAAFFAAKREVVNWDKAARDYGRVAVLSGCMIGTVFLLGILGFALSILVFAGVVAFIAGYRGARLAMIAVLSAISMVLIFRVGFEVWFPRPELFKLIDMPFWLQGVL
ncbi:MAG: tripartite tricarboxylate transporter TctB family protein [Pseudomonadota bacterium]